MSKRRHRRIFNLWMRDHRCHWCGRATILVFRCFELQKKYHVRDDEATIDHLHSRVKCDSRPQMPIGVETTVLACSKCNNERQRRETAELPIEELWKRSGAYPQGHSDHRPERGNDASLA